MIRINLIRSRLKIGGGQTPPRIPPPSTTGPQGPTSGQPSSNGVGWWRHYMAYIIAGFFLLYSILVFTGYMNTEDGGVKWWVVALVASICHFIASIRTVGEQEMGALVFLGKVLGPLSSGPVFAPFPLRIRLITKNVIQLEFGTREGAEDKKAAERDVSTIYGEPFRVTFGTSARMSKEEKALYKGDPLIDRLTFDPHVVMRFQIKDFVVFINEIGDLTEAMEQIREAAKGAIQAYAGTHTPAQMIEQIDTVNVLLTERVEILIGEKPNAKGERIFWGIDFRSASITSPGLPKRVNESMADRGKAAFAAEAVAATAEGERQKREREGAGTAKTREFLLLAEAVGTKALAEAIKEDEGKLIVKLQAIERAIKDGKVTILPIDQSLITAALAVKESLIAK